MTMSFTSPPKLMEKGLGFLIYFLSDEEEKPRLQDGKQKIKTRAGAD